jgi:hypothetical protein
MSDDVRFPNGNYRARAVSMALGRSSNKGTDLVAIEFELKQEGYEGQRITKHSYFTEKTIDRTFEELRICGWQSDDLTDTTGLGSTEVELVIEAEEFEGKTRSKVQWVNRPGAIALKAPMSADQAKEFAARMKERAAAARARSNQNGGATGSVGDGADDIPF